MSLDIQKQVRDNASDIQSYMNELYEWENEKSGKNAKKQNKTNKKEQSQLPIRNQQEQQEPTAQIQMQQNEQVKPDSQLQPKHQSANPALRRDQNSIQNYYKNWSNFDPDKEIEQLEKEENQQKSVQKQVNQQQKQFELKQGQSKPKTKILVKGTRSVLLDAESLKDKGNLNFQTCDYVQALECFTQCLAKLSSEHFLNNQEEKKRLQKDELTATVLSNRAQTYLKLSEFSKSEQDCTQSLVLRPNHSKTLYRRGMALYKMNNKTQALIDFQAALALDLNNKDIQRQIDSLLCNLQQERQQRMQMLVMQERRQIENTHLVVVQDEEKEGVTFSFKSHAHNSNNDIKLQNEVTNKNSSLDTTDDHFNANTDRQIQHELQQQQQQQQQTMIVDIDKNQLITAKVIEETEQYKWVDEMVKSAQIQQNQKVEYKQLAEALTAFPNKFSLDQHFDQLKLVFSMLQQLQIQSHDQELKQFFETQQGVSVTIVTKLFQVLKIILNAGKTVQQVLDVAIYFVSQLFMCKRFHISMKSLLDSELLIIIEIAKYLFDKKLVSEEIVNQYSKYLQI